MVTQLQTRSKLGDILELDQTAFFERLSQLRLALPAKGMCMPPAKDTPSPSQVGAIGMGHNPAFAHALAAADR